MRINRMILIAAAAAAAPAAAFPAHVDNIPNGNVAPVGTTQTCLHCHLRGSGGEGWNEFGQDLLEQGGANPGANPSNQNQGYLFNGFGGNPNGPVWDADVCGADSDGDGFTNGDELGDPDCVWTPGDTPTITDGITNAGDPESFPGGDPPPTGDGGGEDPIGGCSASAPAPVVGLLALVTLFRRRRSAVR